jgi:beta-1,2-mannobiose phosphorylase / 1,2-beta-oligomannan phosphorylase
MRAVGAADPAHRHLRYCAGAMVLARDDPRKVLYCSPVPILDPVVRDECEGVVSHVVFPTGLDPRTPPAPGSRVDVYHGMADTAIGVGWLALPETLPDGEMVELLETVSAGEAAEFSDDS